MEKMYQVAKNSPLFENITEKNMHQLLKCLNSCLKTFRKKQQIITEDDKVGSIGLVISGKVVVQQEDFWGNTALLAQITPGDLFAEAYVCAKMNQFPISAAALEETEILMLDYQYLVSRCPLLCDSHSQLIENLLKIIAEKNIKLVQKISFVTKKTTREKVITYLSAEAKKSKQDTFEIPFNRQEMADYLSVDRSALSKELSKMQQEGLLKYRKNNFQLLDASPACVGTSSRMGHVRI